ncbi:MAG: hypothetical protein AMXMBFR47_23250 [Planctomycetota bacterium]
MTQLQDDREPLVKIRVVRWRGSVALLVFAVIMLLAAINPGRPDVLFIERWKSVSSAVLLVVLAVLRLRGREVEVSAPSPIPVNYVRGRLRFPVRFVRQQLRALSLRNPPLAYSVQWLGLSIPDHATEPNFCLVGGQGSGKTTLLRELMHSVLRQIRSGSGVRALVSDPKRDMLPFIARFTDAPIHILSPFDARSIAWDLAADLRDSAAARHVAAILVPDSKSDQSQFFIHSARLLLHAILQALMLAAPGRWTLRDVIAFARNPERAKRLLTEFPLTADVLALYGGADITSLNASQTLYATIASLEPVAAAWERAPTRFSISAWMNTESVLLLGQDWMHASTLSAINRVLFRRIVEVVLNQPETRRATTWFFLDELKESGRLDGINQLMTNGRSKGARVACAFQDLRGLQSVLGEKEADEVVGLCGYLSFLRLASEPTAEWASRVIGEAECWEESYSFSQHNTTSRAVVARRAVLPSQLLSIPPVENMLVTGFHLVPQCGGLIHTQQRPTDFRDAVATYGAAPAFVERSPESLVLEPWLEDDWARLNIPSGASPTGQTATVADCRRIRFS